MTCCPIGIPIKEAAEKMKLVAKEMMKQNIYLNIDEGIRLFPTPGKKIEDMEVGTAQITVSFIKDAN